MSSIYHDSISGSGSVFEEEEPLRPPLAPGKRSMTSHLPAIRHAAVAQRVGTGAPMAGAQQSLARAASTSGQALPAALQQKFGAALGEDLGDVRVHTGRESAQAAQQIAARAYTVGRDIHFNDGEYDPSSAAGERLLAHEVVHTVQQGGASVGPQAKLEIGEAGDAFEREADEWAEQMVSGQANPTPVAAAPVSRVQRVTIQRFVTEPAEAAQGAQVVLTAILSATPEELDEIVRVLAAAGAPQVPDEFGVVRLRFSFEPAPIPVAVVDIDELLPRARSRQASASGGAGGDRETPEPAATEARTDSAAAPAPAGSEPPASAGTEPAADAQQEPAPAAPVTPPSQNERRDAHAAIRSYRTAAERHIEAHRRWTSANWIAFLQRTGGNPHLSWGESQLEAVMKSSITSLPSSIIFKDAISAAAGYTAAQIGALIGTELAPGVGTVIGYFIGRIVSTASSAIYAEISGHTSAGEAEQQAQTALGAAIEANEQRLSTATMATLDDLATTTERMDNDTDNAQDAEVVRRIQTRARELATGSSRLPDTSNRTLMTRMLRDWVLEHSGDEEDADRNTSETQFEAARDEVFRPGDLEWHPEIFAYQTRGHFSQVGLDGGSQIESMIRRADVLRAEARQTRQDRSSLAQSEYDGHVVGMNGAREPFRDFVTQRLNAGGVRRQMSPRADLSRVNVSVTLDLTTSDGSCYVDCWDYRVVFPAGTGGFISTAVYEPGALNRRVDQLFGVPERFRAIDEHAFSVSPD